MASYYASQRDYHARKSLATHSERSISTTALTEKLQAAAAQRPLSSSKRADDVHAETDAYHKRNNTKDHSRVLALSPKKSFPFDSDRHNSRNPGSATNATSAHHHHRDHHSPSETPATATFGRRSQSLTAMREPTTETPIYAHYYTRTTGRPSISSGSESGVGGGSGFSSSLPSSMASLPSKPRRITAPPPSSHHHHARATSGSGSGSDGSGLSPNRNLDMKRLLSKPALPSPSCSSTLSIPSDSESRHATRERLRSRSRHTFDESKLVAVPSKDFTKQQQPQQQSLSEVSSSLKPPTNNHLLAPPKTKSAGSSRESSIIRSSSHSGSTRESPSPSSLLPAPSPPAPPPPREGKVSKPRNVIRRKSSLKRSASTATLSERRGGGDRLEPRQDSNSSRGRSPNPSLTSTPSTTSLTPAGAVAYAYKVQEDRRDAYSRASSSVTSLVAKQKGKAEADEAAAIPYYTVLGNMGRVVAVGGPGDQDDGDDDMWKHQHLDSYYTSSSTGKDDVERGRGTSSEWARKSFGRTVSGKWKKAVKDDDSGGGDNKRGVARPSLQIRRTRTVSRERRRSLDMDKSVEDLEMMPKERLRLIKRSGTPRRLTSTSTEESPTVVVGTSFETLPKVDSPSSGGGSRLWNLVKRISSGGLREKYLEESGSPPPVPAIPKEKFIAPGPRPSMSMSPTPLTRYKSPTIPTTPQPPSKPPPGNTTTSSPASDAVSIGFDHHTFSAASSTTSYGDEPPPPLPKTIIAQHIIPPSELFRMDRSSSPPLPSLPPPRRKLSRDIWLPSSPVVERPSLPFPPRRSKSGNKGDRDNHPAKQSKDSSWSSTSEPLDIVFKSSRNCLPYLKLEPPEPSTRSTSQSLSTSVPDISLPSHTLLRSPRYSPPDDHYYQEIQIPTTPRKRSSSHSNASTTRQRPRSNTISPPPPTGASALTFRELEGGPPRRALSEQEKLARWDDLLERSDRAGGTLHIGGETLASDEMSVSNYSVFN